MAKTKAKKNTKKKDSSVVKKQSKETKSVKKVVKSETKSIVKKDIKAFIKTPNQYMAMLAESFGTFVLSAIVLFSSTNAYADFPVATPLLAALTLGLFVYTIGHVSGTHINPAVTLGLLSINKVKPAQAARYIFSQLVGAVLALSLFASLQEGFQYDLALGFEWSSLLFEIIGTMVFAFGIASVVYDRVHANISGLVIGCSLLLGISFAVFGGLGVLNPAVAFAAQVPSVSYILGPIVGSVLGFNLYRFIDGQK